MSDKTYPARDIGKLYTFIHIFKISQAQFSKYIEAHSPSESKN